jgi:hypothetical protein
MLRSCYLFQLKTPYKLDQAALEHVRLIDFDTLSHSLTTAREVVFLKRLTDRVVNERFERYQLSGQQTELTFSCTWKLLPPGAATSAARVRRIPISFPIWLREDSRFTSIFAPRKGLALGIAWLLSQNLFEDYNQIRSLRLGYQALEAVESWLNREDHVTLGSILRATFEGVQWQGNMYDELTVRRNALGETELFTNLKRNSKNWRTLTFVSPLLSELDRQLTCRIESSGKFTVYTPTVTPLEFDIVLQKLQQIFLLLQEIEEIFRDKR